MTRISCVFLENLTCQMSFVYKSSFSEAKQAKMLMFIDLLFSFSCFQIPSEYPSNLRSPASDVQRAARTGILDEIRSDGYDMGSVTAPVLTGTLQTDDQTPGSAIM
jgi:hypothetical protein